MNDNDIIKALEMLLDKIRAYECENVSISKKVIENILDLINRLKAKNKEFDEKIVMQRGLIDTQKVEIERLQKENIILSQKRANIFEILNAYERGRKEVIKEFAERLKEEATVDDDSTWWVANIDLDNLVKEMTEE